MPAEAKLLGRWIPEAARSGEGPFTEVEFLPGAKLKFIVHTGATDEEALVDYRVEQDAIVTQLPGESGPDRTRFQLLGDGALLLEHGGHQGRYVRR